jgi:hypothetical protein
VRTLTEALRQETGASLRVTGFSPGFVHTDFANSMIDPRTKALILEHRDRIAIPSAPSPSPSRSMNRPKSMSTRSSFDRLRGDSVAPLRLALAQGRTWRVAPGRDAGA